MVEQTAPSSEDSYLYADLESLVVPGRQCGTCTLCCRLIAVEELNKPRSRNCIHCIADVGCGNREHRPHLCRAFFCNWLLVENLGPEWKPDHCGLVLQPVGFSNGAQCLVINVDPDRPDSWRRSPYFDQIKAWAARAAGQTTGDVYYVLVIVDERRIVVLPDRDIDLGDFGAQDQISIERKVTPLGASFTFRKVSGSDSGVTTRFV